MRWIGTVLAAAAAALSTPATGATAWAAEALGTVTVAAGEHDRQATPVTVALPGRFSGRSLVLAGEGDKDAPLAIDTHGAGDTVIGTFILPSLARGRQARFTLREAPGRNHGEKSEGVRAARVVEDAPSPPTTSADGRGSPFSTARDPHGIELRLAGRPVLRYQTLARSPDPTIRPGAVRGGYLHPLYTPAGVAVTDDYHPLHRAHHGIWTAWPHVLRAGKKLSFWGSDDARIDFAALGPIELGAARAHLSTRHEGSEGRGPERKIVLDQSWQVTVYRTHVGTPPYHLFDLEWTDRAVGNEPFVLEQHIYGGLGLRGHADWNGPGALDVITSEPDKDRVSADGSRARWLHMGGLVAGKPAGFAILVHPQNFRAPQPFRVNPKEPFISAAPARLGNFAIEPGKPYSARYRFMVADGKGDRALLERLYQDYANPPVASFAAAPPTRTRTRR